LRRAAASVMVPALADISVSWVRLRDWLRDPGIALLGILAVVIAINIVLARVLPGAFSRVVLRASAMPDADVRKRAETLGSVLFRSAQAIVLVIGGLMMLDRLGYTVAPVLTGLGIGGIAVGLGAQSLVRDMISGTFILAENQFARGDLVTV